ncbi:MAG: hypothetical protein RQ751_02825 [Longimicrobiales bacterium]|nr:hypothetical protein [Longimicrobiales bacterium]
MAVGVLALALGLAAGGAAPARAQTDALARECSGGPDVPASVRCRELALVVQAVQAGAGLGLAGGAAPTGAASTLGRRFGRTPRLALSGKIGVVRFPLPDVRGPTVGDQRVTSPTLHATATLGLLNGFSPLPTVGGVFSLDLLASLDAAFLSDSRGFPGTVGSFGYGARLGLLRESFTLPGVTVSVMRRHSGTVEFLPQGAEGTPRAAVDVTTTSVRGVVGKELIGAGFLVGVGWDRYDSDGTATPRATALDPFPTSLPVDGFDSDRVLLFGGVSRTFLVLQIAGEAGWAEGFGDRDPALPGFDPGAGSLFAALSLRVTF